MISDEDDVIRDVRRPDCCPSCFVREVLPLRSGEDQLPWALPASHLKELVLCKNKTVVNVRIVNFVSTKISPNEGNFMHDPFI